MTQKIQEKPVKQSPYAGLDLLRSIAIIWVLCRHAVTGYHYQLNNPDFLSSPEGWILWMQNGLLGVDIFFVLSGYLITQHLYKNWERPKPQKKAVIHYLKHRLLRIIPPYYAFLFIVAFGLFPFYTPNTDDMSYRLIYHLLFLQDYLKSDFVVAFWSLGTEIKFYLLMPFIFVFLLSGKFNRDIFVIIGLIVSVWISRYITSLDPNLSEYQDHFEMLRSPFHTTVDGLLMGALSCVLLQHTRVKSFFAKHGIAILLLSVMLGIAISTHIHIFNFFFTHDLIFSPILPAVISSFCLIAIIALQDIRDITIHCPGAKHIARISYSLYITHMAVIPLAGITMLVFFKAFSGFITFFILYLLFSYIAAYILHLIAEKPYFAMIKKEREKASL